MSVIPVSDALDVIIALISLTMGVLFGSFGVWLHGRIRMRALLLYRARLIIALGERILVDVPTDQLALLAAWEGGTWSPFGLPFSRLAALQGLRSIDVSKLDIRVESIDLPQKPLSVRGTLTALDEGKRHRRS